MIGGNAMYRPNDARFGFARWWYWCGSRLWRGRIKIVSVGARAGLVISRLVRFFDSTTKGVFFWKVNDLFPCYWCCSCWCPWLPLHLLPHLRMSVPIISGLVMNTQTIRRTSIKLRCWKTTLVLLALAQLNTVRSFPFRMVRMISLKWSGADNIITAEHTIMDIMYRNVIRASIVAVSGVRGLALAVAAALVFYRNRLTPFM